MDTRSRAAKILSMIGVSLENKNNSSEEDNRDQFNINNNDIVTELVGLGDIVPLDVCTDVQTVEVVFEPSIHGHVSPCIVNGDAVLLKNIENQNANIPENGHFDDLVFQEVTPEQELIQLEENMAEIPDLELVNTINVNNTLLQDEHTEMHEIQESSTIADILQEYNFENNSLEDETYQPAESDGTEALEEIIEVNVRTRKKRRHVDETVWKRNDDKTNRRAGLQYYGKRKRETGWDYKVPKSAKAIKERCNCNGKYAMKCNVISDEDRNKLFNKFWELNWGEKKIYITTLIEKITAKRPRNRKNENSSRREFSYNYYIDLHTKRVRVCKTMFCNTFAIPLRTIGHWIIDKSNEPATDNKAKKSEKALNPRTAKINEQKHSLKLFFDTLPKLESHYCRKSSNKLYLEPTCTSKSELYKLYKEDWCSKNKVLPLSIASFASTFDDLNLSLFSPKKDECDICVAYKTDNISQSTYQDHLKRKEDARTAKDADKLGDNRKVFSMDLQSVLLAPKSNVSSLYYKTKLIVHNFTIFNLKTKDGYCYLWHEGDGGLTSNVFSSIIYKFLTTHVIENDDMTDTIILYSDGCTYQNRNATLSNALLNLAQEKRIIIEQKYLEKGHTQMECDSMHSTIERKLRKKIINVPADYVEVCQTARLKPKPYHVEYLDYKFFRNFDNVKFISSIRPGRTSGEETVNAIRALKYNQDWEIYFKTSHCEEWRLLPCRYNKTDRQIVTYDELPRLYLRPIPIKAEKYQHLMSLKSSIKKDYHCFYDSLSHL